MGRPASRDGRRSPGPQMSGQIPRAASPQPQSNAVVRSRSPQPMQNGMPIRERSPAPPVQMQPDPNMRSRSPAPDMRMGGNRPSPAKQQAPVQQQARAGSGRPTSSYGAPPSQYSQQGAPSSYDRGRGVDPAVRRERSKSIAAPGMPAGNRQSSNQQYCSASPNPYAAAAAQTAAGHRPRSGTTGTPYMNGGAHGGSSVQLSQPQGEIAMYEPPGNADVSPSVCFMGKSEPSSPFPYMDPC